MDKIELDIVELSSSENQSGAYVLVLKEKEGKRKLPIIIGSFEAQAIAIELEKMFSPRPLTHDLFKNFADAFEIQIIEIIIYKFHEGLFYSKLMCDKNGEIIELDSRTSDAIALSVRFKCPIYTYESIVSSAEMLLDDRVDSEFTVEIIDDNSSNPLSNLTIDELKIELNQAIEDEDYELACQLRDELNKRNG